MWKVCVWKGIDSARMRAKQRGKWWHRERAITEGRVLVVTVVKVVAIVAMVNEVATRC